MQGLLEEETIFENPQRVVMERRACTQLRSCLEGQGGGTRWGRLEQMVQSQEREHHRAVGRGLGLE